MEYVKTSILEAKSDNKTLHRVLSLSELPDKCFIKVPHGYIYYVKDSKEKLPTHIVNQKREKIFKSLKIPFKMRYIPNSDFLRNFYFIPEKELTIDNLGADLSDFCLVFEIHANNMATKKNVLKTLPLYEMLSQNSYKDLNQTLTKCVPTKEYIEESKTLDPQNKRSNVSDPQKKSFREENELIKHIKLLKDNASIFTQGKWDCNYEVLKNSPIYNYNGENYLIFHFKEESETSNIQKHFLHIIRISKITNNYIFIIPEFIYNSLSHQDFKDYKNAISYYLNKKVNIMTHSMYREQKKE